MNIIRQFITFFVCFLPLFAILIWAVYVLIISKIYKDSIGVQYSIRLLLSVDQATNVIFDGDEDETISSRLGKNRNKNWFTKLLSKFLDLFQDKHVEKSVEEDEG